MASWILTGEKSALGFRYAFEVLDIKGIDRRYIEQIRSSADWIDIEEQCSWWLSMVVGRCSYETS